MTWLTLKDTLKDAVAITSFTEWFAFLTSLGYILLIILKKQSAWFFAIISSLLYHIVFYDSKLYLESILQLFYVIMGILGWITWKKATQQNNDKLITWSFKAHVLNGIISVGCALLLGYLFKTYTHQFNPYTDAFTTVFSLAATYMVTKKILENWVYWILIDSVALYLFTTRDLYLTALLYLVYAFMAIIGLIRWIRLFKLQTT
jgi:nicotinamide mononucleotide transporter